MILYLIIVFLIIAIVAINYEYITTIPPNKKIESKNVQNNMFIPLVSNTSNYNSTKVVDKITLKNKIYRLILLKTAKVFNELDIPFFLSSGTLLGYYRDNTFIPHDYDIDVGIMSSDYTFTIKDKMIENGFVNYRNLGDVETGYEMSFYLPNTPIQKKAKIDIFLHYPEKINHENKLYWVSYKYPHFIQRIKYRVSAFTLKPVKFLGIPVNIPTDTERYLREHYGEDWYIPKSHSQGYRYSSSPKSIVQ